MKFLANIDLVQNQLLRAVVHNSNGAPAGIGGQIYFDTSSKLLYYHNGAGWVTPGGSYSGANQILVSTSVSSTTPVALGIAAGNIVSVQDGTGVAGRYVKFGASGVSGIDAASVRADIGAGTVNSISITGNSGISIVGSPITNSGTIGINLTSIPNSALANSSITLGTTAVALGTTATSIVGLSAVSAIAVSATTFTGAGTGLTGTATNLTAGKAVSATDALHVTDPSQPAITSLGALTSLNVTGAITAVSISGAGVSATTFTGAGTGLTGTATNLTVGKAVSATDALHVTDASQPAITSLGTLTGLAVNGATTSTSVSAVTVSAGTFTGAGTGLTGTATNLTVGNATNATNAVSATDALHVTDPAQPAITSVGTLTGLAVNGAITATSVSAAAVSAGQFYGAFSGVATSATYAVSAGVAAQTNAALTFSNTGGAAPGSTFNGSIARQIDFQTIGAVPASAYSANAVLVGTGAGTYAARALGIGATQIITAQGTVTTGNYVKFGSSGVSGVSAATVLTEIGAAPLSHAHAGSGSVTSIQVTGTNGITTTGGPITTSGTISISLTGPLTGVGSINGLSLATSGGGFNISGGTGSLTVLGSGTLGTAAYTASGAYATAAQGTLADNAIPKGTLTANYQLLGGSGASQPIAINIASQSVVGRLANGVTGIPIVTDLNVAGVSADDSIPSAWAAKKYVDTYVAAANALTYKGTQLGTASASPAGNAGDLWLFSTAGSAWATNGPAVEPGDMLICTTDGTVASTWSAGASGAWNVIQKNLETKQLPRRFTTNNASAAAGAWTAHPHGLGTALGSSYVDITVNVFSLLTVGDFEAGEKVYPDIKVDENNVYVKFAQTTAADQFRIVAVG